MSLAKKIACITLDIEPDLQDQVGCVRMFDSSQLLNQYSSIVLENNIKVTGYIQTSLMYRYSKEIIDLYNKIPIEFGVHSHTHECNLDYFEKEVETSVKTYRNFFGTDPCGYRAPNGLINENGIRTLMEYQFKYDSSIFPSVRFDKYGYSNLNLPITPFVFVYGSNQIVEFPIACLSKIRLIMSMSYIKLFGLSVYKALMRKFPLPDVVILDSHPYDFYVKQISDNITGWKRYAHLRNADQAFSLFQEVISVLIEQGYDFWFMSDLNNYYKNTTNFPRIPIDALR